MSNTVLKGDYVLERGICRSVRYALCLAFVTIKAFLLRYFFRLDYMPGISYPPLSWDTSSNPKSQYTMRWILHKSGQEQGGISSSKFFYFPNVPKIYH